MADSPEKLSDVALKVYLYRMNLAMGQLSCI